MINTFLLFNFELSISIYSTQCLIFRSDSTTVRENLLVTRVENISYIAEF